MSYSRSSLISLLEAQKIQPIYDKSMTRKEFAHKKIHEGNLNRIFDEFEILDKAHYQKHSNRFYWIFNAIIKNQSVLNSEICKSINQWIKELTCEATHELIFEGEIRQDFINCLALSPEKDKLEIAPLICAYIGAANQMMIEEYKDLLKNHLEAYQNFCTFFNENYGSIVREVLNGKKIFVEKDYHFPPFSFKPLFKMATSPAGLLVLGSLFAGVVGFLSYKASNQKQTEEHKKHSQSL